ncbi:MAG TPA: TonB family protein [Terriglobales bacterium]|nr:TonB family protein [Terriglobales bacterium]
MAEVRLNLPFEGVSYPVKRSYLRRGLANARQVKARLGAAGEAVVLDVSENGIGVQLQMPLQPGSSVPVDLDLPESGGHVRVDGRVIWSNPGRRAGIRFEKVPESATQRLKQWVSRGPQTSGPKSAESRLGSLDESAVDVGGEEPVTLEHALSQVLARAITITKATGAAVAIGTSEKMVCRASQGNAPDVGVPIQPDSGLTGHCIRNRAVVHCEDTDADERVNAEACREMELRSALVIPVFSGKNADELSGILEVFSSRPRAFTGDHIAKLEKLAKILGVVASDLVTKFDVQDTEKTAPQSIVSEPKPGKAHSPRRIGERSETNFISQAAATATARAPEVAKVILPDVVQPANVELHSGVAEVKPAALVAPVVTTQIAAKQAAVKLAELTNQGAEASAHSAQDFNEWLDRSSKAAEASVAGEAEALPAPSFLIEPPSSAKRIQDWIAAANLEGSSLRRVLRAIGVVVIAMEIAAALFLYSRWDRKRNAAEKHAQAAIVIPPPKPVFFEPSVAVPTVTVTETINPQPKRKTRADDAAAADDGSDDVIVNRLDGSGATSSATSNSDSQKTQQASATADTDLPAPAPAPEQENLASLRLPDEAAKPSLAVRLSSGTTGGALIKRVNPIYPETAKLLRLQGQVVVKAHVAKDGSVSSVRALKGNEFLAGAAEDAVRQWRYSPMKLNGVPVEMDTTVTVQFKMPN